MLHLNSVLIHHAHAYLLRGQVRSPALHAGWLLVAPYFVTITVTVTFKRVVQDQSETTQVSCG